MFAVFEEAFPRHGVTVRGCNSRNDFMVASLCHSVRRDVFGDRLYQLLKYCKAFSISVALIPNLTSVRSQATFRAVQQDLRIVDTQFADGIPFTPFNLAVYRFCCSS